MAAFPEEHGSLDTKLACQALVQARTWVMKPPKPEATPRSALPASPARRGQVTCTGTSRQKAMCHCTGVPL